MDLAIAIYRAVDDGNDFIFVDINSGVEAIEQVKRENLIGKSVTEVFPGVEEFGLLDVFKRVHETGVPESHPISFYEDDRIAGWRDNYVYRLDSGEVVAVYRDETERKQMEEEIRKSRDEKNAIIEGAADPIIVNNEERILFFNQKAVELLGYSDRDELIGKPFINLFSKKHQAQIKERARLRLDGRDVSDQYDSFIERLDGAIVPVEFHLSLIEYNGSLAILNIIRDISERKRVEERLLKSEERFRLLYEKAPLGYQSLDKDGCLKEVNNAWLNLLGYSQDEVIGRWFGDFLTPQYFDLFRENFPRFKEVGETEVEFEMVRKDGSIVTVSIYGTIGYDEHGKFIQTHCNLQDITERKYAEEALKESETKYRSFLDESHDGVTVNVSGELVYVNPRFSEMIGYSEEELFGLSVLDLHAPQYRDMIRDRTLRRSKGEDVPTQYEVELVRKDGSLLPVSYSVSRIMYEGQPSSLTFIRDISARKILEKEVQDSEERYRTLFDSTKEGILRFDASGFILSGNQAAADILGYENPQEMIGLDAEILYESSKDREYILQRLEEEGSIIDVEVSTRKKDGSLGLVSSTVTVYKDPVTGDEIKSSLFQDISDRKRLEETLRESEALFRGFMQSATDGFSLLDDRMRYVEVNNSWLQIIGLERKDVNRKHILELFPRLEWTERYDAYQKVLETGEPVEFYAIKSASGPDLFLDVSVFKVGDFLGIVVKDVTDQVIYQRRLEVLHNHAAALASTETLGEVVGITENSLNEVIGSYVGGIAFIEGEYLDLQGHWGKEWSWSPYIPLSRRGITNHAVNTGTTQNVGDVSKNPYYNDTYDDQITVSELAVPIIVSGKSIGVINLESAALDAFSENDQRLVETLASHIASAFAKIKYNERLSALHSFAFEFDTDESVEDVIETSSRIMGETFESQLATIQLVKDEALVTVGSTINSQIGYLMPLSGNGVTVRVAREAKSVLLGDVRTDSDFIRFTYDTLSELAVPILVEDSVLGVLNLEGFGLDAFSEDDLRLMEVLAQNVGAALYRIQGAEEKRELERQVLAEQVRVEQEMELSRLKNQFISTATHELRTPVTSILGFIEIILANTNREIPAQIKKDLDVVYRNANRLVTLTNDLLDVQRISSGRFEIQREQVDIVSTLYEMLEELSPLFDEKHQVVDLVSPKELIIDVDEVRIGQLFINLLRNANKFTHEQGQVIVNVEPSEDHVLISVKDTGIGLSYEDLGKLFKPFPGIRHGLGVTSTGLGLAICKGIVDLHDGEIWAESEGPEKGSTFYVKLPI